MERLEVKLLPYLRQISSTVNLRVGLLPKIIAEHEPFAKASYDSRADIVDVSIPSLDYPIKNMLASIAHEAGHIEQEMEGARASEIDAWHRGLSWAKKWNVVPEYLEALRNTLKIYESWKQYPGIISGLRKLEAELSAELQI